MNFEVMPLAQATVSDRRAATVLMFGLSDGGVRAPQEPGLAVSTARGPGRGGIGAVAPSR